MTSLIFWGPYLAHKSVVSHRREKQRLKNYERWEDLRDDYDEQRKLSRDTQSLDLQRTGQWDNNQNQQSYQYASYTNEPQHCLTLRDQQEANDARLGWRPQEAWDSPKTQLQAQMTGQPQYVQRPHMPAQRHISMAPAIHLQSQSNPPLTTSYSANPLPLPLRSQKTGATWDEGIPSPLAVSRRSFEGYDDEYTKRYRGSSPASSSGSRDVIAVRQKSGLDQAQTQFQRPSVSERAEKQSSTPDVEILVEVPKNEFGFVEPAQVVAGGRMAELIERGY